ncbi:MAG: hypothetical protein HDS66_02270 [Bacteroidales bacterium]|nr:hypothetical protein [Bacteroidales bacterium]
MKKGLFIALLVAGGLLVGYASILLEYTEIRPVILLVIALVFGLGGALFSFLKGRQKGLDWSALIVWVIAGLAAAGLGVPSVALIANYHTAMARSEPEQMKVLSVTKSKKTVRTGRRGRRTHTYDVYHARLTNFLNDTIYVPITASEYRHLHRGNIIEVEQGKGIFGWTVHEVIN